MWWWNLKFHFWFYFGYIVELFFCLSGYFMFSYIEKIEGGLSFPRFYLKRYLRLAPMLLIGAVVYEFFLVTYHRIYTSSWMDITASFWGIIIDALGIQDGWVLSNPCVNNPTWYISVLLLCYIIFYFIVYLSHKLSIPKEYFFIFMIFLGMGIQTYAINLPFLNNSSSRGYYAFFFGILLHEIIPKIKTNNAKYISCFIVLIVITLLIIFKTEFMALGINYIMTFIYYPSLIFIMKAKSINKIFNLKVFRLLGKASFDVYIWHNPFYILLYIVIKVFNWKLDLASLTTMIGYATFCYLFGVFSYFCIEKPISEKIKKIL